MMTYQNILRLMSGGLLSLGLLWQSPALAELPADQGADVEVSDEARESFRVGVALLQDPDGARYEQAFKAFMKAYQQSPSWKILGNLGLCAFKLERYTEGIEAYERYLKYGAEDLGEAELKQVSSDLRIMKGTSVKVSIKVEGIETAVSVRDVRSRSMGGPIENIYDVQPGEELVLDLVTGQHLLSVNDGDKSAQQKLTLEVDREQSVVLTPEAEQAPVVAASVAAPASSTSQPAETAEQPSNKGMKIAGIVVASVGGAALIGGGVTTALGFGLRSDLNERCPNKTCSPSDSTEQEDFESDQKKLKSYGTMSTALFIAGGVFVATGATLIVLGTRGPKQESAKKLEIIPSTSPAFAGLLARGTF